MLLGGGELAEAGAVLEGDRGGDSGEGLRGDGGGDGGLQSGDALSVVGLRLGVKGTVFGGESVVGKNAGVETGLSKKGLLDSGDFVSLVKLFKKINV